MPKYKISFDSFCNCGIEKKDEAVIEVDNKVDAYLELLELIENRLYSFEAGVEEALEEGGE